MLLSVALIVICNLRIHHMQQLKHRQQWHCTMILQITIMISHNYLVSDVMGEEEAFQ